MKYMLDTNICIYLIKHKPIEVFQRFEQMDLSEICISSITHAELLYGAEKSREINRNKIALLMFTAPIHILEFDTNAAISYGEIRADLERRGQTIGPMDLLIAAHAKSVGITLVSNNTREFERVSGLQLENWVDP